MGKGAALLEVIYADDPANQETATVMVTIGDTVRAQDWAKTQYPDDAQIQEQRAGLYAVYLGAKRGGLRGTDKEWLDWLDMVTIPDDTPESVGAVESGESEKPPSES